MNHDERDQQLEAAYRRASEVDAGRPAAATRVAILAEAAGGAAARRRATPAANESRYWMRAVAGLAVVGVGILLWRQTDHRLPGESSVMVAESMQDDAQFAAAPEADAANTAAQSRELRAEQPAPAPAAQPSVVAESQQKAAAPPAADLPGDALATTQSADFGAPAREEREQAAAPFASGAAAEADGLLRRHFPAQYQSDSAHRLWLVRNAAGEVLQFGELMSGQSLEGLAPQLESNLAGRRPATWRTTPVINARGQPIELSVGDIP